MCGICGIFYPDRDRRVSSNVLAAMNQQIVHRGPDDGGFLVEENVGLAMRRLSIIDIRTGHQPIANENESVWIVYNGEIYNHQELRVQLEAQGHRYKTKSDTETIVHLYEQYGCDCVTHLRGMFAFAIWDRRNRKVFAARDRLGIKPFYYRFDGQSFLFGSEIKTILVHPGVHAEFNRATLGEYLAFGYVSGEDTMYSGIRKLLPGHTIELDERGKVEITPYWDLNVPAESDQKSRSHYVQSYREMLEGCVSSHLMSDVPLGVFLSGGLDSSAVAALTTKIRREPIETFAVGYGEEEFSELPFARRVAEHIGSKHQEVRLSREEFFKELPKLIWHEDEPIVWPSSVALYFVARLARERVTVVLTGEGSDETLGGYTRYAWTLMNSRMDHVYRSISPAFLRNLVRSAVQAGPLGATLHRKLEHTFLVRDGSSWPSFYFDNFYSAFSDDEESQILTESARSQAADSYVASMKYWEHASGDLLHRLLYTDIKTYLVELLMKQDQMSMATSIESRVPFLDHEFVEFSTRVPGHMKLRNGEGKYIVKKAIEGLVPNEIIYRKKMGFPTPLRQWLMDPRARGLFEMLRAKDGLLASCVDAPALDSLLARQLAGREDATDRIWRLLNLQLWGDLFLTGKRDARWEGLMAAVANPGV